MVNPKSMQSILLFACLFAISSISSPSFAARVKKDARFSCSAIATDRGWRPSDTMGLTAEKFQKIVIKYNSYKAPMYNSELLVGTDSPDNSRPRQIWGTIDYHTPSGLQSNYTLRFLTYNMDAYGGWDFSIHMSSDDNRIFRGELISFGWHFDIQCENQESI